MTEAASPAPRTGVAQFRAAIATAQTSTPAAPAAPSAATPAAQAPALAPISVSGMQPAAANDNNVPPGSQLGMSDEIAALDRQIAEQGAGADPNAPAAEGGGEQLAGMPVNDLVAALKGSLTEDGQGMVLSPELAPRFWIRTRMDGQDVLVPADEAARGGIRAHTFTRKTQELAQQAQALEDKSAKMRELLNGWDDPTGAGILQSLERIGKTSTVRAKLRENWGSPEQPNIEGFYQDLQASGHWGTFIAAANQYAEYFNSRINDFAPGYQQLPPDQRKAARDRAVQMIRALEAEQIKILGERAKLHQQGEEARAAAAKAERERLLAAQPPQQQQADPAQIEHISGVRERAFKHFGLSGGNPIHEHYFGQFLQAEINLAKRENPSRPVEELIARAAESVRDQLFEDKGKATAPTTQPHGAKPAPGATMPARPVAAPTAGMTSGIPGLPDGGTARSFQQRIKILQSAGKR